MWQLKINAQFSSNTQKIYYIFHSLRINLAPSCCTWMCSMIKLKTIMFYGYVVNAVIISETLGFILAFRHFGISVPLSLQNRKTIDGKTWTEAPQPLWTLMIPRKVIWIEASDYEFRLYVMLLYCSIYMLCLELYELKEYYNLDMSVNSWCRKQRRCECNYSQ